MNESTETSPHNKESITEIKKATLSKRVIITWTHPFFLPSFLIPSFLSCCSSLFLFSVSPHSLLFSSIWVNDTLLLSLCDD